MEKIKINTASENDEIQASYIDSAKYVEEVFKTQRPNDILRLTQEDPYHIVDTDILDFKFIQLFQLNNIIPVVFNLKDPNVKRENGKKVKSLTLSFEKNYYNLDEKKIYRSASGDVLEVIGLMFLDVHQKPIMDSRFQRYNFIAQFDMGGKKIGKIDDLPEQFSAQDIDSKIFYFSHLDDREISRKIDSIIDLSNYLLNTRDVRLRLRSEIRESTISNVLDLEPTDKNTDRIYELLSLFDYFRLDIGLLFSISKKDVLDIISKKMETKLYNHLRNINDIYKRDEQNYYRSLCKTAYIRKYGVELYNKLPKLRTIESTLNAYPIIPDILPLLDKKIAQVIKNEVDIIVQNNLIDSSIYTKNRKIINLANAIKTEKFPDQQWKKFKELLIQLGLKQENPFVKNPNWIEVDGIKILCRHHYVHIIANKKQLSEEETHKKLLEFTESDGSEYCKVCSELLTYRDKFEGLVSTYESDNFRSSYDDTFKLIQRAANIWVYGYLVNTFKDNDYANRSISKNIANILYDFLKPIYDKLTGQKNKDPVMVGKKFNIYLNTYVGAAIIKIVEDNSDKLGLYGVQNLTQTVLIEEVFKIIKKIIGNDLYIFEDISESKIEQGIKNAYKTLTDAISKIEYKNRAEKPDYDPYKELLLSLNKEFPIPDAVLQLTNLINHIRQNNILYNQITLPSEDNLSIQYSDIYSRYLKFARSLTIDKNVPSYRFWVTSTLLLKTIIRQSYEFDRYVQGKNSRENLNLVYGITPNYHNLKKIDSTAKPTKGELHKHSWNVSVWGKKNIKWNGTVSDSSIVVGNSSNMDKNLSYIDTLCSICGKSLSYPGDDDMTFALRQQNEIENFYRYFRFICPKDRSDHKFIELKDGTQKCSKCGLELRYISEKNGEYYHKYHDIYEKETEKKTVSFRKIDTSKNYKSSIPTKEIRVDPQFSKRLAEELSQKMVQDKNKREIFLTKLNKLGNTEGVLYNSKEFPDPNRTVRGITLNYYLLKIIGMIGMARRSELRDITVPKINELVKLGIKYEIFSEPLAQYDNIINIIGRIAKIDNNFALYICDNLFLSDQHNSKLEKSKEAEIQSNINFEQADQSYIDNDQDMEEGVGEDMFSYENMDYDGHNDDV